MNIPNQAGIGVVLMIVGTLLFIPGAGIGSTTLTMPSLVLAATLLTAGTYLFGTSEPGRPV